MENNKSVKEELKRRVEESLRESVREQEIDRVMDGLLDVLDGSSLSPIEILGILEVVRHTIHEEIELTCKEEK